MVDRLIGWFQAFPPRTVQQSCLAEERNPSQKRGAQRGREKKKRERHRQRSRQILRSWGGRGRARAPVTSRSNAAFATPRGRDSSSLATDEGCCTKSLRQPRARAQNPYSPARSWHPRSVSHPSSLSLSLSFTWKEDGARPLLSFFFHPSSVLLLALFALLVALDNNTRRFVYNSLSLSRSFDRVSFSLDRVPSVSSRLFLEGGRGGSSSLLGSFSPLFSAAVP